MVAQQQILFREADSELVEKNDVHSLYENQMLIAVFIQIPHGHTILSRFKPFYIFILYLYKIYFFLLSIMTT